MKLIEENNVVEFCKTLKPITDWSKVKKGDKIFHQSSLNINYVDTFIEAEEWSDNRLIVTVTYKNYKEEEWNGSAEYGWYYYK